MELSEKSIKCVVVGDRAVGKTSLLRSYASFDEGPTIVDEFATKVSVGKRNVDFKVWNTSGQEDYNRLRHTCYNKTDVFLICFSIVDMESFRNVKTKWAEEIKNLCPDAVTILVGTKKDLRYNIEMLESLNKQGLAPVFSKQGASMAKAIGASFYLESSKLWFPSVKEVFSKAVIAVTNSRNVAKKEYKCILI